MALLQRFLIDSCRRSLRTGMLASFFFRSALADNLPATKELCSRMETDIEQAVLSGNKNPEMGWQVELFKVSKKK